MGIRGKPRKSRNCQENERPHNAEATEISRKNWIGAEDERISGLKKLFYTGPETKKIL